MLFHLTPLHFSKFTLHFQTVKLREKCRKAFSKISVVISHYHLKHSSWCCWIMKIVLSEASSRCFSIGCALWVWAPIFLRARSEKSGVKKELGLLLKQIFIVNIVQRYQIYLGSCFKRMFNNSHFVLTELIMMWRIFLCRDRVSS